jgi:hypothetical protein
MIADGSLGTTLPPHFFATLFPVQKAHGNYSDTLMCGHPALLVIVFGLSKLMHCYFIFVLYLYSPGQALNLTS